MFLCLLPQCSLLCVRCCWLAIVKLIKFPKEQLLRAPSCEGLCGQVLAELTGSQESSLCRTGVITLPFLLASTVLYFTGRCSSSVVNGGSLCVEIQDAITSSFFILFIIFYFWVYFLTNGNWFLLKFKQSRLKEASCSPAELWKGLQIMGWKQKSHRINSCCLLGKWWLKSLPKLDRRMLLRQTSCSFDQIIPNPLTPARIPPCLHFHKSSLRASAPLPENTPKSSEMKICIKSTYIPT